MRILYISERLDTNTCAKTHLQALKLIVPEEDLFVVNLSLTKQKHEGGHEFSFGNFTTAEKISWVFAQTTWFLSIQRINKICSIIQQYNIELVYIDTSYFGKLTKKIKQMFPDVKILSFYHDITPSLYRQSFQRKRIKFRLLMSHAAIKGERLNQKYCDVNLVLNKRDANEFHKYYHRMPEDFLPMGVPAPDLENYSAEEYSFPEDIQGKKYILFVGAKYAPNIEGLEWFVKEVFREICDRYILVVIGRGLEYLKESYENEKNVVIVGGVRELAPFYNNANLVIAPIFSGGGMKQKTAEAFAYGKTFIGTQESLEGYEKALELYENDMVFRCDTKEEYLQAFTKIESTNRFIYNDSLNKTYWQLYSEKAICNKLREHIYS